MSNTQFLIFSSSLSCFITAVELLWQNAWSPYQPHERTEFVSAVQRLWPTYAEGCLPRPCAASPALNPPSLPLFFCLPINFSHQDAKFAPLQSHHKLLQPLHSWLNSDEWISPALIIQWWSGRAVLPAAVFISYWEADLKQISGKMTGMLREAVRRASNQSEKGRGRQWGQDAMKAGSIFFFLLAPSR